MRTESMTYNGERKLFEPTDGLEIYFFFVARLFLAPLVDDSSGKIRETGSDEVGLAEDGLARVVLVDERVGRVEPVKAEVVSTAVQRKDLAAN